MPRPRCRARRGLCRGRRRSRSSPGAWSTLLCGSWVGPWSDGLGHRDQCADLAAVRQVILAVLLDEIALLEPDAHEDVAGGHDREEEVADGHVGRGPEGDEEAEHEGVADQLVRAAELEADGLVGEAAEPQPNLAEAEEVEVVDDERGGGDEEPAGEADGVEEAGDDGLLDVPEDAGGGAPEEEDGHKRGAGE